MRRAALKLTGRCEELAKKTDAVESNAVNAFKCKVF